MSKKTFIIQEDRIEILLSHLKHNEIDENMFFFDPTYRALRSLLFFSDSFETHEAVDRYLLGLIK